MFRLSLVALITVMAATSPQAQTFEETNTAPTADEIKTILGGNVFTVNIADGTSWRLQFNKNGYYYVNTSTGYTDDGEWHTENGRLCVKPKKTAPACNDARLSQGFLVLKRLSGEVVVYRPRNAVGTPITGRPPHRSERAQLRHSAPTLGP